MKACWQRFRAPFIILVVILMGVGCARRERERQNELEGFTAARLQQFLALRENHSPVETITNVVQIFEMMDLSQPHRAHPHTLQKRFREFGPNAGFKNSIYEKYVVVRMGITDRGIKGEMIFMSAEPFPDLDGRPIRMVIWRAGAEDYRHKELDEDEVHRIFSTANIPIPRPPAMPAPGPPPGDYELSYPPTTRVRLFFQEFAQILGLEKMLWFPLMLLCAIAVVGTLVFSIWLIRRNR